MQRPLSQSSAHQARKNPGASPRATTIQIALQGALSMITLCPSPRGPAGRGLCRVGRSAGRVRPGCEQGRTGRDPGCAGHDPRGAGCPTRPARGAGPQPPLRHRACSLRSARRSSKTRTASKRCGSRATSSPRAR